MTVFSRRALLLCLLIASVFSVKVAYSQSDQRWTEEKKQEFHNLLQDMYLAKEFNGTVLLAQDGEVIFHKSYGFSNIADKKELDEDSSFRLASVSKQFTAMGIMILKEQGKLNYDDPITKHLTSLPYEDITIRHLLHHTSGLADYMSLVERPKDRSDKSMAFNQDTVAAFAKRKPELLFEPGSKFMYSNTGYVFLGHIIEVASGQSVHEFIRENILAPAEMSNSGVFSPTNEFDLKHRVYGFRFTKADPGYRENDYHYLNGMIGDGGIYASALDLLRWDQALYGELLVKQSTLKEAFQSGVLEDGTETGYGFGWGIDRKEDGRLQVSHSGGWVGFATYIGRNITKKRTLIVLSNNSSSGLGKIFEGLKTILESSK